MLTIIDIILYYLTGRERDQLRNVRKGEGRLFVETMWK